jgi:hypothetical protein
MKTPERFNKALKTLVQAFFNDTLAKGNCTQCAVGNMCGGRSDWSLVFITPSHGTQRIYEDWYDGNAKNVIDKTGYTWEELARIEFSFEKNTKINGREYDNFSKQEIMEDQYRGLMAVVEVLCEIEGLDCTPYKEAFAYNSDLQPINSL